MAKEANEYILGTDRDELFRLGVQHQVWASEAQQGWNTAGFTAGDHILDLGCGPGFVSQELAFLTGKTGKVTAIDRSEGYIRYIQELAKIHDLNIAAQAVDFNDMELGSDTFDGMYCRWALAWVHNPKEIVQKVYHSLKPGAKMVIQEYYDWSTHQLEPSGPNLNKCISQCLLSFKEQEGDIDVGRHIPSMLSDLGMKIQNVRIMQKLATPADLTWHWPKTFYYTYFPRLVDMGYISQDTLDKAYLEFEDLEKKDFTTLFCPVLIEIIAEKI